MTTTTVRQDKDANATLRYVFDWDPFVTGESETVSSTVVVVPSGVTVTATTLTASTVTITVAGGTEGTTYAIVNRIETSGGQREDKVLELSITQAPSVSHTFEAETGSQSATANAYATVANGDTYHAGHLYGSTWQQQPDAQKEKALIFATRLLDENYRWNGTKATDAQALQWPRAGTLDRGGYAIDSNEIPTDLKNATAELARLLLANDLTADPDTLGFREIQAGSLRMVVDKADSKDIIPKAVVRMLAPLGTVVGSGVIRLVRS